MTTTTELPESLSAMMSAGGREGPKHYFGLISEMDIWDCALQAGRGKVPFDPAQHRREQRCIAVTLAVSCTKQDGSIYTLDQSDITSSKKMKVTLASLEALGVADRVQLAALKNQRWCQVVRVPTGDTYVSKRDQQTYDELALKVLALYDTEAACKAAEADFYTPRGGGVTGDGRNVPQPIESGAEGGVAIDEAARQQLLATLPMIWDLAQKAPEPLVMLKQILDGNPKYAEVGLTLESDEVQIAIGHIPF
jgi:hypothetical protein